jgi:hypothetical protein
MAETTIITECGETVRIQEWPEESTWKDSWFVAVGAGQRESISFEPNRFRPGTVMMEVEAPFEGNCTFFVPVEAIVETMKRMGFVITKKES